MRHYVEICIPLLRRVMSRAAIAVANTSESCTVAMRQSMILEQCRFLCGRATAGQVWGRAHPQSNSEATKALGPGARLPVRHFVRLFFGLHICDTDQEL